MQRRVMMTTSTRRQAPKTEKRRRKAVDTPGQPRRLELLKRRIGLFGELSLHWLNRYGRMTPLREINEFGVRKIYETLWSAPEASFRLPSDRECWLRWVREYADVRHIDLPELKAEADGREFVVET